MDAEVEAISVIDKSRVHMNLKKLFITFISIYTGLIATACVTRYLDSLARHGDILWSHVIYPVKIVLLSVSIYVYVYLRKNIDLAEGHFLIDLIKLSPLRLGLLSLSSGFAFSQYEPYKLLFWPFKILLFRW